MDPEVEGSNSFSPAVGGGMTALSVSVSLSDRMFFFVWPKMSVGPDTTEIRFKVDYKEVGG